MKIIAMFLILVFSVNISALTKEENKIIKNALDMYLAKEKGLDKLKLLLFKQLAVYQKDGKTYKTIELYLKESIASQVYFRRLKIDLGFNKQKPQINVLPYAVVFVLGVAGGVFLMK